VRPAVFMPIPVQSRVTKFLLSGAANTLVTYVFYLWLLNWLPYRLSFSISFFTGIVLAYLLARYVVFQKPAGRLGPVWMLLIYVLQYLLGLFMVTIWVKGLSAPPFLAPIFATLCSLPVTYLLSRRVFRGRHEAGLDSMQQ
jgi:putative flippase GtrA